MQFKKENIASFLQVAISREPFANLHEDLADTSKEASPFESKIFPIPRARPGLGEDPTKDRAPHRVTGQRVGNVGFGARL